VTQPYLDYPFVVDGRGRAATTSEDDHVRDLIEQVLFTDPGERVNRPDFGCGLRSLLFMPNSDALAVATQMLTKGALQRWLEDEIQVDAVEVRAEDERLVVTVAWTKRTTGESRVGEFPAGA
jgi:phage baseplate assembly protein W